MTANRTLSRVVYALGATAVVSGAAAVTFWSMALGQAAQLRASAPEGDASRGFHEARDVDLSGIDTIVIEAGSVDVSAVVGAGTALHIDLTLVRAGDNGQPPYAEVRDGTTLTLDLRQRHTHGLTISSGSSRGSDERLAVGVPSGFHGALEIAAASGDLDAKSLSLGRARLSTASGDVKAEQLHAASLAVSSASGDISLRQLELTDTLDVSSTSGDVTLESLTSRAIHAASTSGDLHVAAANSPLELSTVSGDLRVAVERLNGPVGVKSVSGDLEIVLPADAQASVTAKSISGEISFHGSASARAAANSPGRHAASWTLGQGGTPVHVETVSGDVQVIHKGEAR